VTARRAGARKVVPFAEARRARDDARALRASIRAVEEEVARARAAGRARGVLRALLALLEEGRRRFNWQDAGRAWSALYFAWHSEDVDEFGYDRRFTETVVPFFELLYALWWRVEVDGIDHVPDEGAALLVANHSGVLPYDGIMLNLALRRQHRAHRECRMLALDMFALLPFLAPLLARTGSVRANPENAERLLRRGELVGVFPEGVKGVGKRYRERYKLARFGRGGFVRVALRTGASIVPCAIVGAEEIHPMIGSLNWLGRPLGLPYLPITPTFPALGPLGLVPLPTKWWIEVAEPIPMEGYGPDAAEDPILVNRLSEEVRATIQRMVDWRLAQRRSIFFG
jgi:1-acyl-sn-glycerol-3-phosphate acyltransferase